MKIAYYIDEGIEQLILTPENKKEEKMLSILDSPSEIKVYSGEFYHCLGGWARQGSGEKSRIITMKPREISHNRTL
jgi:hypothetical protein